MPDEYNAIDWALKSQYSDLVEFCKGLIAMRKEHPAFSLGSAEAVRNHLSFIENDNEVAVGFVLDNLEGVDTAKRIVVLMNGSREGVEFDIPAATYKWISDGDSIHAKGMGIFNCESGKVNVAPISGIILAEY
jgi:pullulanase